MTLDIVDSLREMAHTIALAGHERKMIRYMKEKMTPLVDEIRVDNMGNVISTVKGTNPDSPSLMLFAHMDQLGFVVRKIESDGYLRLERLGGVPEKSLLAQHVIVEAEDGSEIPGVIGSKSHHYTPQDEKYVVPGYKSLFVDIGAKSKAEVTDSLGIHVGSPVVYAPKFSVLGGRYLCGTSMDNRVGCFVLLRVLESLAHNRPESTVYVVATTQEEYNLRGALPAAQALQPDLAVALDLVIAGDSPDLPDQTDIELGGGPAVTLYSFHGRGTLNGLIPHPGMVEFALESARSIDLHIQRNVGVGVLTDISYVQLVGEGIPSLDLGYPCRYTHTPAETVAIDDIEQLATWVTAFIGRLSPGFALSRE